MEKQLILLMGIQGAGKTSFYEKHLLGQYVHINLDTLHTRHQEALLFKQCLLEGKSMVIDNTNPMIQDREKYIRPAQEKGYQIIGYYFKSVIKECINRNNQRQGKQKVPTTAIACTSNKFQLPSYTEGFDKLYYVQIVENGFSIEEWEEEK